MSALLKQHIKPFEKYFKRKDLVEICINKPGQVWLETVNRSWEVYNNKELSLQKLNHFASTLATSKGQRFDEFTPLLSTELPDYGYRVQAVGGGLADSGFGMAIRIPQDKRVKLESYTLIKKANPEPEFKIQVQANIPITIKEIKQAILDKKTIIVVGGTGSGKTVLCKAMIRCIPHDQRLIIIEDTKELIVDQPNQLRLLKSKTSTDVAQITYKNIIDACKRLRPDRILMGELDSNNTTPFLRILNTGHGGSITTLHANSVKDANDALIENAFQSGYEGGTERASNYIKQTIDIIVFIERISPHEWGIHAEYLKDTAK